jgi:hypothetical protein
MHGWMSDLKSKSPPGDGLACAYSSNIDIDILDIHGCMNRYMDTWIHGYMDACVSLLI